MKPIGRIVNLYFDLFYIFVFTHANSFQCLYLWYALALPFVMIYLSPNVGNNSLKETVRYYLGFDIRSEKYNPDKSAYAGLILACGNALSFLVFFSDTF